MKNNKNLDVPKIVIVGHVDHGKSSFIGRLLYDIGEIQEEKYKELKKASKKVKISPPEYISSWTQQHQNNRNHLYHFKSNPSLKLLKKVKLGDINFK